MDIRINLMIKKSIFCVVILIFHWSCKDSSQDKKIDNFQSIDLFNVIYKRPLNSLEIESNGRIIEYVKSKKETRVYQYNLTPIELDSLKKHLKLTYHFEEPVHNKNISCVDGVSYYLSINTKHKVYNLQNIICENKTPVDQLVLYILNLVKNKEKSMLFKNQKKYEEMLKNADSILKLTDN